MSGHTPHVTYERFVEIAPRAREALVALGKVPGEGGLDRGLIELVKLRVSQINGCAFCLQIHLDLARRLGVAPAKLDLLAAWRDSGLFSPAEAAALAWAEQLTCLSAAAPTEAAYADLRAHFSEADAVLLGVAIATINAWNRLGAGLRFAPGLPRAA